MAQQQVQEIGGPNEFARNFKWQRRHIVVDHFNKKILIQVMHDQSGELRYPEFQAIKQGNYQAFLPNGFTPGDIEVRKNIRDLAASGYQVQPMFFHGIENEEFAVLLLTDIHEPKLTQQAIS